MQAAPTAQQDSPDESGDAPEPVEDAGETVNQAVETLREAAAALTGWAVNLGQAQLAAIAVAAGGVTLLAFLRAVVSRLLKGGDKVPELAWRKILGRVLADTHILFILFAVLAAADPFLGLPEPASTVVGAAFRIALIIQLALWIRRFALAFVHRKALGRGDEADGGTLANALAVLTVIINFVVVAFAILLLLDNAGIEITPLLAGLGVGGLAIGLAAQGVFSDLFAALSIIFDKPFEKGDFIEFGTQSGTVEKIGLRTTHIRSLTNELIVVSNTSLLEQQIHNYQRMAERRVFFGVGVTYQTDPDKAEKIPAILKEAIEAQDRTRFDRAHFVDFGDSSLDYQAVYYITDRDFVLYRDIQQAINLHLYRRFAEEGIEFAYPTRTLHFSAPDGEGVSPREFGASAKDA